jgi:hypothetical protein
MSQRIPHYSLSFKVLRNRKQLNKVVTEITSRIEIYRQQGAWSLFMIYDPTGVIVDEAKFLASYVDEQSIWIGIAR